MNDFNAKDLALGERLVDAIAERLLGPLTDALSDRDELQRVPQQFAASDAHEDRWLNANEAASYLGNPLNTLYKLTAAHSIPCQQAGPNVKLWFKRSELDEWPKAGEPGAPRPSRLDSHGERSRRTSSSVPRRTPR